MYHDAPDTRLLARTASYAYCNVTVYSTRTTTVQENSHAFEGARARGGAARAYQ
jgi:hypothetical protein